MIGASTRVAIVGPGRLGTVLAGGLARNHRVVGAAGGSAADRARFAARFPGARTAADPAALVGGARLILLATPDDALEEVVTDLVRADALGPDHRVVHVSGAWGLAPLRRAALAGAGVAACHPGRSVASAEATPDTLVGAAWAVTATSEDRPWAHALVRDLGGDPVDVDEDVRALYHAGFALASEAAGAVAALARQLLLAARIDDPAAFLRPAIEAGVETVLRDGASAVWGPVARGDAATIERHAAALAADVPGFADAYRHLMEVVLAEVGTRLPDERIAAVRAALEAH